MRQKKIRLEDRPTVSKYAKKRMETVKTMGIVTGNLAPPPDVINKEAKAYLWNMRKS